MSHYYSVLVITVVVINGLHCTMYLKLILLSDASNTSIVVILTLSNSNTVT